MFINCRDKNMCVLCKNWLGDESDMNYITGNTKVRKIMGLCRQDGQEHYQSDICRYFIKSSIYS